MRDLAVESPAIQIVSGDPVQSYRAWRSRLLPDRESLLCVQFALSARWLESAPDISLTALYLWRAGALEIAVVNGHPAAGVTSGGLQFDDWVSQQGAFVAREGRPLPLLPLHIEKPWGREIWFNGVERRGVCEFGVGGSRTPQPWLLAVLPGEEPRDACPPPPLLKILEPSPLPVIGDLYFEMHDVKQEVYVVTHIDRRAWPAGTGYLRFGFCPHRLAASDDEAGFRQSYLRAVSAYRLVREQLDALPAGAAVDPSLAAREASLRERMNDFTWLKPLQVGDVIEVPQRLPHALQHGVRVVEFQTPVFERKILSFAQQVHTQAHWDTAEAVGDMRLLPPPGKAVELLSDEDGVKVERVADTPEFEVRRLHLAPGAGFTLGPLDGQAIAIVLQGRGGFAGCDLGPEQAARLPAGWGGEVVVPESAQRLVFLLALVRS